MDSSDRTASLMTPAKLAQVGAARAPVSPSAWLDRMAADVGHQHVRRLLELRQALQGLAGAALADGLQSALQAFMPPLKAIDFDLLQRRGWLAGLTGKSRSAGAEFAAQFARADDAAQTLAGSVSAAAKGQQAQAGAVDRALLEFEVEFKALDKIIDQGARWLQDMRNQLKTREALDAEAQRRIDEDTTRCELLVARLKALRAAAAASQDAHQQTRTTLASRASLLQAFQQVLGGDLQAWRSRLGEVAAAASAGRLEGDALALAGASKALRHRLKLLLADCEQLRTHEAGLLDRLDAMADPLGAAS